MGTRGRGPAFSSWIRIWSYPRTIESIILSIFEPKWTVNLGDEGMGGRGLYARFFFSSAIFYVRFSSEVFCLGKHTQLVSDLLRSCMLTIYYVHALVCVLVAHEIALDTD